MKITTSSYILPAFDGKIFLRIMIDRPVEQSSVGLKYLLDYSSKICNFAHEKLFLRLSDIYKATYSNNNRVTAYHFTFKILCTFENERVISALLISRLFQGTQHLFSNADSVIILDDRFIPWQLITAQKRTNAVLILNSNATPCWVDVSHGGIEYESAEKCKPFL